LRGERIVDGNGPSDTRGGLGEVSTPFRGGGDGGEHLGEAALPEGLKRGQEGLVLADRPAEHTAKLIAFEAAERNLAPVVEKVIRVELGVPQEVMCQTVELVGAALVNEVQHRSQAASELGCYT
jgi:hypothetical protein